mmetsp:Transcript_13257/g.34761  ORF Transcript_13257/g.34761 Transcript_13257/m.34761 type:complete len:85 (+) Transcript_13257:65-319(+)
MMARVTTVVEKAGKEEGEGEEEGQKVREGEAEEKVEVEVGKGRANKEVEKAKQQRERPCRRAKEFRVQVESKEGGEEGEEESQA